MNSQIAEELRIVREHRILFAHHSVGSDLLSGLQRLSEAAGAPLNIISIEHAKAHAGPGLIEIWGGENHRPRSKVDHFAATIRARTLSPELAFMKFCYVDFAPSTDVGALFSYYQQTLDALKAQHPEIRFAHVTVPLVTQPMNIKQRLYRALGRAVWEDAANARRQEFNRRLLDAYAADPIFDLARAESTRPDGSRATFAYDGRAYFHMVQAYTDDGGHLNRTGQDAVSPVLLHFMAAALRARAQQANL